MRLRKRAWVDTAILEHLDLVHLENLTEQQGRWQENFAQVQPLHLEIGTGRGAFLIGMAARFPQWNFLGIESNIDIVYDVLTGIKNLPRSLPNIHMIRGDARLVDQWFAPGEISQIYLNFSDPWPKNRHAKRRLTYIDFLRKYQIITQEQATVKQKTDSDSLFAFTLETLAEHNFKLLAYTTDLYASQFDNPVATEYERRFVQRGKAINYCEFALH